MDVDLKIGAVFSLADTGDPDSPTPDDQIVEPFCDPEDLLPDADESDEIDIMSGMTRGVKRKPADMLPMLAKQLADVSQGDDFCHEPQFSDSPYTVTPFLSDTEAPPSLQLEGMTGSTIADPDNNFENTVPPILQPETITRGVEAMEPSPIKKRKIHTKIYPSYIVLTNADHLVRRDKSVSYRSFKELQTECSNMCKKTHFRRRLHAGKDVFNVKTPSKHKDYEVYLKQFEEEREKKILKSKRRVKPQPYTALKDLLQKHDKIRQKRTKSPDKKYLSRVRRNISRVPNDFKEATLIDPSGVEVECENTIISKQEQEKIQHKIELDSLKRLIMIKRRSNKKLKLAKKSKANSMLDRTDGTKSFSGRVRKTNNKYKGDFAMSKYDLEEYAILKDTRLKLEQEHIRRLKQTTPSDKKETVEKPKQKVKKTNTMPKLDLKGNDFDIVIENPEDVLESPKVKQRKSKDKHYKTKKRRNATPNKSRILEIQKETESLILRTRQLIQDKMGTDGVLIQDMPSEGNVISKLLQTTPIPLSDYCDKRLISDHFVSESKDSAKYSLAKSLLKASIAQKQKPKPPIKVPAVVKKERIDTSYEDQSGFKATDSVTAALEKYKKLKIPENVQKLFTKTTQESFTVVKQPQKNTLEKGTIVGYPNKGTTPSPGVITLPSSPYELIPTGIKTITQGSQVNSGKTVVNAASLVRIKYPAVASKQSSLLQSTKPPQYRLQGQQLVSLVSPKTDANKMATLPANTGGIVFAVPVNQSAFKQTQQVTFPNTGSTVTPTITSQTMLRQPIPVLYSPPLKTSNATNMSTPPGAIRFQLAANLNCSPTNTEVTVPEGSMLPKPVLHFNQTMQSTLASIKPQTASSSLTSIQSPNVIKSPTSLQSSTQATLQSVTQVAQQSATQLALQPAALVQSSTPTQSTVPIQDPSPHQSSTDKSKFYLLKIEGKNILIPIDSFQAQPKAYVVNSTSPGDLSQVVNSALKANAAGGKLTMVPSASQISKPTATITPSLKAVPVSHQYPVVSTSTNSAKPAVAHPTSSRVHSNKYDTVTFVPGALKTNLASPSQRTVYEQLLQKRLLNEITKQTQKRRAEKLTKSENAGPNVDRPMKSETFTEPDFAEEETPSEEIFNTQKTEHVDKAIEGTVTDQRIEEKTPMKDSEDEEEKTPMKDSEDESKDAEVDQQSPKAFAEAVSAREERLRRLKELLKQKQQAVEEIRLQKT